MIINWIRKIGSLSWITMVMWLLGITLCYGSFVRADLLYQEDLVTRTKEINSENSNLARSLAQNVNRTFTQADGILLFMKTAIEANGIVDPVHLKLLNTFRTKGVIDQIAVADAHGNLLFSAALWPLNDSVNISDRQHFKAHIEIDTGQVYISSPHIAQSTGVSSTFISRRLNDANGNFAGIVSIGLSQGYFHEELRQLDMDPDKSILLMRTEGGFLVRVPPLQSADQESYFANHPALSYINRGQVSGIFEAPGIEQVPRIGAFQVLPDYPVSIAVAIPKEVVFRDILSRYKNYRIGAALFSSLLLLALSLLSWLGRKQYKTYLALQASDLERKTQEKAIWRMAYCDSLTGLSNRAFLMEHLDEELEKSKKNGGGGAILFIDVDDLKAVNDTFGHSSGDKIIITVGNQIVAAAGERAIVARIGGDEFIVVLTGESGRDKIAEVASSMTKLLNRNYDIGDVSTHISASIGIALYPMDGGTAGDFLRKADLALYTAKDGGKNTWRFYEASMGKAAYDKMMLKSDLRKAIDRGELSLHYQPIVEMCSHRIIGFEALLRWTSLEHGSVPPSLFIPLAEENDTIQQIGKWVLKEACSFADRMTRMGKGDIYVAVNVSARQIATDDFVSLVCDVIYSTGIQTNQLELEITESLLMTSMQDSIRKLDELRAIGVRLSLDDFGTGYSSLTRLRLLPVSKIKIHKSFIDQILTDEMQLQYIQSIVKMGQILGLSVVAEGVETSAQMEKLVQCQCEYIQGYFFSRPVSEKDAILLIGKSPLVA